MKTKWFGLRAALLGGLLVMQTSYAGDPQPVRTFDSGADEATCSFTPDGKAVLIGCRLFNVATGELLHLFDGVGGLSAISYDGKMAVTQTTNGIVLWDLPTREKLRTLQSPIDGSRWALSHNGEYLAIAGWIWPSGDNFMLLYAVSTGQLVRRIEMSPSIGSDLGVTKLVFSPDGTTIAAAAVAPEGLGGAIALFDSESGQPGAIVSSGLGVDSAFHSVAFSPDGKLLAGITHGNRTCHVWDLATGQSVHKSPGCGTDIAFSPDGRFLLVGGYGTEGATRIISVATGREVRFFPMANPHVRSPSVVWSPDGSHVLFNEQLWQEEGISSLWDVRDVLADLRIVTSQSDLEVRWDTGSLQYTATLDGNWTDLPDTSPLRLSTIAAQGYFRVRVE